MVELETSEVLGYEALARGPDGPLSRPDVLIEAARVAGMIAEADWSCRASALRAALDAHLGNESTLFVNVEADVIAGIPNSHADLLNDVGANLRIVLEVTEKAVVRRPAELLRLIDWARDRSWGVALDDVGANPLCLALMPFLEPDVIKLDLRLVHAHPTAEIGTIVSAVLSQAERTGATVVAEGIETGTHLEAALALGATLGQGWYFGRPGPLPEDLPAPRSTIPLLRTPALSTSATPFSLVRAAKPLRQASSSLLWGIAEYLEEQAVALHDGPVIISTFQADRELGATVLERYATLAGNGSLVVALAPGAPPTPAPGVVGASLEPSDEWSLVIVGPHYAGAMVARQRPDSEADRRWDYAVTHDRDLVVAAGQALLREVRT